MARQLHLQHQCYYGRTNGVNIKPNLSCTNLKSIQSIVNTLKIWVEQYWPDFHANERLLDTLTSFVDSLDNPKLVQMLKTSITRKLTNTEAPVIEMPTQFPKPILPKLLMKRFSSDLLQTTKGPEKGSLSTGTWNFSKKQLDGGEDIKIKLAELDPLEVARQLTLIEFELFMNIKPREFLDLAWMKDDKEQKAPNIIKMVRWSNHVIHWLVTEIVTIKDNVKQRALMMEKIIAIGQVKISEISSLSMTHFYFIALGKTKQF